MPLTLARGHAAPQRGPGPHPLPLFLAHVTAACAGDPERLSRVLAGLARYQAHVRPPRPDPARPVAAVGATTLRELGGEGRPLVVVPSLINPPRVLDLPHASLVGFLAASGWRILMVDWGAPEAAERRLDLAGYVDERLVPLLAGLDAPPAMLGYCLGGTLALALAARRPVARLALLAAPWRFSGHGEGRAAIAAHHAAGLPLATALGAWPMDLVQPGFWALDPPSLAAKFERFAGLPPGPAADAFVALEDWANDGPPLALGVAAALAAAIERGLDGAGLPRPDPLPPTLDVVALRDRIVPAATAFSPVTGPATGIARLELPLGHVGMVVGGQARARLWEPLAHWFRSGETPS